MRESIPVMEPKSAASPVLFVLSGARCAAAVFAIASSISLRCVSAVLVICSSFLSPRPLTLSCFLACFHSRRLMTGNPSERGPQ